MTCMYARMYVYMYVCMYVGPGGEVLGSWSMSHGFEPHHSQMDIIQSSSSAFHYPH